MSISTVPRQARPVRQEWDRSSAEGVPPDAFDPAMLVDLPEPARRWLTRAVFPWHADVGVGKAEDAWRAPLGAWRQFTASQVLAPPDGYIWAATASVLGVPVIGYDRLSSGTAGWWWGSDRQDEGEFFRITDATFRP